MYLDNRKMQWDHLRFSPTTTRMVIIKKSNVNIHKEGCAGKSGTATVETSVVLSHTTKSITTMCHICITTWYMQHGFYILPQKHLCVHFHHCPFQSSREIGSA